MTIESTKININVPAEVVYRKVSNFSNLGSLMPAQVQNWKATENSCSFEIVNMLKISMTIAEKEEPLYVHIVSDKNASSFAFTLHFAFDPIETNACTSIITIGAELNPFMASMAKKPLDTFVNELNNHLKTISEAELV